MSSLSQLFRRPRGAAARAGGSATFADDARAMRATLEAIHAELGAVRGPRAEVDVRAAIRDLLDGEYAVPTADLAAMKARRVDADEFYAKEVAPSWDGLNEAQRAARLDGFLEMCSLLESAGDAAGFPAEMAAGVRTKTLLLAWAFDETYGYLSRLGRGAD
ncbi:MAG: hypothetical protein QOG63_449 [Thermoleophilaceae bacterium]|jgi:hypothetical protein|nr:hypothetical protein [Thermoleophilaceae bacterium]